MELKLSHESLPVSVRLLRLKFDVLVPSAIGRGVAEQVVVGTIIKEDIDRIENEYTIAVCGGTFISRDVD